MSGPGTYEPEGLAGLATELPTDKLADAICIADDVIARGEGCEVTRQRRQVFADELVRRGALPPYRLMEP